MKESEADGLNELLARTTWVRAVARAIVKDVHRADDLAQDAWVRALEGGPRRAESWKGWFATVMRNRANEERRASARCAVRDGAHDPPSAQLTPPLFSRMITHVPSVVIARFNTGSGTASSPTK